MLSVKWVSLFLASGCVGVFVSAVVTLLRKRFQKYYCVEEVRTFDDGNRVVWTSNKYPLKYAEQLMNQLALKSYELRRDNWFRVVPYEDNEE